MEIFSDKIYLSVNPSNINFVIQKYDLQVIKHHLRRDIQNIEREIKYNESEEQREIKRIHQNTKRKNQCYLQQLQQITQLSTLLKKKNRSK